MDLSHPGAVDRLSDDEVIRIQPLVLELDGGGNLQGNSLVLAEIAMALNKSLSISDSRAIIGFQIDVEKRFRALTEKK